MICSKQSLYTEMHWKMHFLNQIWPQKELGYKTDAQYNDSGRFFYFNLYSADSCSEQSHGFLSEKLQLLYSHGQCLYNYLHILLLLCVKYNFWVHLGLTQSTTGIHTLLVSTMFWWFTWCIIPIHMPKLSLHYQNRFCFMKTYSVGSIWSRERNYLHPVDQTVLVS